MEELETQRLILRPFSMEDVEQVYRNWASQDEIYQFLPWSAHENIQKTKQVIQQWIENEDLKQRFYWCIVLKDSKECIGTVYFTDYDRDIKQIETGFCVGKAFWNKGYMAEALCASSEWMLTSCNLEINQIVGTNDIDNPGSGRAMEKAGYSFWKEEIKFSLSKKVEVVTRFYRFDRSALSLEKIKEH